MAAATDPRNETPASSRCDGCGENEQSTMKFQSTCGLMEVRRPRAAIRAPQPAPQVDSGIVLAEPLDQARHVEDAPVIAAPANRDDRHVRAGEFTERALLLVGAEESARSDVQRFERQYVLPGWTRHREACTEQTGNMADGVVKCRTVLWSCAPVKMRSAANGSHSSMRSMRWRGHARSRGKCRRFV